MVERNVIRIAHKIFRPQDIQSLCRLLEGEFDKLAQKTMQGNSELTEEQSAGIYRKVNIALPDGRSYSGHPRELLDDNDGPLFSEPVKKVLLSYADKNQGTELICSIAHSQDVASEISIESDQLWSKGMKGTIEAFLGTVENQATWPRWYHLCLVALTLILTTIFWRFAALIVRSVRGDNGDAWPFVLNGDSWPLILVFLWTGLVVSGSLVQWMIKFWPVVELQTGREFMHLEKRKRNLARSVVGLLISMFVSAIVSWLLG